MLHTCGHAQLVRQVCCNAIQLRVTLFAVPLQASPPTWSAISVQQARRRASCWSLGLRPATLWTALWAISGC